MRGKLEKKGRYELFKTDNGNKILNLNNRQYFAVIKGDEGDMLIDTDADHKKQKVLKKGKFFLADFEDDPAFRDQPHLFLEEGEKFREWILPNNTPSKKDYQKKLVKTGQLVSKSKVEKHIKGEGNSSSEEQYKGKPESLRTKTKDKLYKMARRMEIEGRSYMNKEELVKALAKESQPRQ